jgi:hypothetical protein
MTYAGTSPLKVICVVVCVVTLFILLSGSRSRLHPSD